MKIDILSLFPEMFEGVLASSIIKRAIEKGIVEVRVIDYRSYSLDKHHKVDDTIYGGGAGMLISVEPIVRCLSDIEGISEAYKIITSPTGKVFNQAKAKELARLDHLVIVCGHYEGIDARINNYIDEEVSIGDYILTGGEVASMAILDSVVRLLPGAISDDSTAEESFSDGLLEYDQYTKPASFDGYDVPFVLTNGNHEEIRKWRKYNSLEKTYKTRPDLIDESKLSKEDKAFLEKIKKANSLDNSL